ncbi:MAG TPA: hypothetical protein VIG34_06830 [Xanthobacteraceae bacterium]|jgi:MFS family permease
MAIIGRVFMIALGFCLASFAAAATITIGAAVLAEVQPPFERVEVSFFWLFTLATSAGIAFLAFVPAMIAILLAESFSWRSILYYALIGGAIGFFFGAILPTDEPGRVFLTRGAEIMAGAGVAAGLVYWLFAGRNAGRWHTPDPVENPKP